MVSFEAYKFDHVYEFEDIIYKMVEDETMFWAYDNSQLIDAVIRYNKISLLHIYIYTQLLNYHGRLYRKYGDCYDEDAYYKWVEIANTYGVKYKTEYDEDDEDAFYHWYKNNESVFQELFQYITDEVFYCLFANHPFLVRFNNIVAALIKNENEERDFDFPKESIEKNGTIKRCSIPQWAKLAVFHRDHGRCVFCGKDLTNVYTHSNAVNYDHIVPLNRYGANDPCNLQTTCEHCNKSKQDKEDNPQYQYEPWWK